MESLEYDIATFMSYAKYYKYYSGVFNLQGNVNCTCRDYTTFIKTLGISKSRNKSEYKIVLTPTQFPPSRIITPEIWNSCNLTQITQYKGTPNQWETDGTATTLLELSNYHIKGDPTSILMLHGSASQHFDSLQTINVDKSHGFYLSLDPSEALTYGCWKLDKPPAQVLLLEIIVHNAHELILAPKGSRSESIPASGDIIVDDENAKQILGRDKLVRNIEIVKRHLLDPFFNVFGFYIHKNKHCDVMPCIGGAGGEVSPE
jgi:hypothetical protein